LTAVFEIKDVLYIVEEKIIYMIFLYFDKLYLKILIFKNILLIYFNKCVSCCFSGTVLKEYATFWSDLVSQVAQ